MGERREVNWARGEKRIGRERRREFGERDRREFGERDRREFGKEV